MIRSKDLFTFFKEKSFLSYGEQDWSKLIVESLSIKASIVSEDEKESGVRKLLNFGHTAGHALESLSLDTERPLSHGEAVSKGTYFEAMLSCKLGLIDKTQVQEIKEVLELHKLPVMFSSVDFSSFYKLVLSDKKNSSGKVNWTLISEIGVGLINQEVERGLVEEVFNTINENSN